MRATAAGSARAHARHIHGAGERKENRMAPKIEFCTLLVDDQDGSYVYGVYYTENEALNHWRQVLVDRFGEDAVIQQEELEDNDEGNGLADLVPFRLDWFELPVFIGITHGIPAELIVCAQVWRDLVKLRAQLDEEADGEMAYEDMREIEDRQLTAATNVADYCSTWLRNLGKIS